MPIYLRDTVIALTHLIDVIKLSPPVDQFAPTNTLLV